MIFKVFSYLLIIGLTCSCSVKDDMKDMKDTTKEMKKSTEEMGVSTDHIESRTEDLFVGSRELMSIERQNISLDEVVRTSSIAKKLTRSSIYFLSMEYQHWLGNFEDDLHRREELLALAVESFFNEIDDLVDDDFPVSTPFLPRFVPIFGETQKNWEVLSVLSVTMSKVHSKQERVAKKLNLPVYSMFTLITEGLKLKKRYEAGDKVPLWAEAVLYHEQVAIYLLQLRHNFFPLIIASKISNIEDGFFNKLEHLYFDWSVELSNFNSKQLETWCLYLDLAEETKLLLGNELSIHPEINSNMIKIFGHLHWLSKDLSAHQRYLSQLGMNPEDEKDFKKFKTKLNAELVTENHSEEFIIKVNKLTGASLFLTSQETIDRVEIEQIRKLRSNVIRSRIEYEAYPRGATSP